jgi:thiamine kinase-like enzyme
MNQYKNAHLSHLQDAWQADLSEQESEQHDLLEMYEKKEAIYREREEGLLAAIMHNMEPYLKARKDRKIFTDKLHRLRKKINSQNEGVLKFGENVRFISEHD